MRLSLCQPLVLSPGPEVRLGFSIVGFQAVRCVLVVCRWVHGCHRTIVLDRSVTDLDTSENRNGQGLPPNVAQMLLFWAHFFPEWMGRERFWLPQADWTALGFWVVWQETVALQGPFRLEVWK